MHLKRIERFTGHNITPHVIPGLEPKRTHRPSAPSSAPRGGFGKRPAAAGAPNGNRTFRNDTRPATGYNKPGKDTRRTFGDRGR